MLETYIRDRKKEKKILLMTHIVMGYPSFDTSFKVIEAMVAAGVDLMELQIPFSEPIADGPVILKANQVSLAAGTRVADCMEFAGKVSASFPIPFLFMSYCNILFRYGMDAFAEKMAGNGIKGAIVPDIPPEEGSEYLDAMKKHGRAPIFIFSPTTTEKRMEIIDRVAEGFIYCVARKGVTGQETTFSNELEAYLTKCRNATRLPLAVGFGIKNRADVAFLEEKADIAVIGSETIRIVREKGVSAVRDFISGLRE